MTTGLQGAVHPLDAASIMRLLPTRPRVLALGEPAHGADALLEARNVLFQQLVERENYRTLAIESDCVMGLLVDDYVCGAGSAENLDGVMARGFSHEFGASAANRELVRWMRAFNDDRPESDHVHFAGFDGPLEISAAASPRQALSALHAYLAARLDELDSLACTAEELDSLLGPDEQWTNPAAMMDPVESIGRSPDAKQLRILADELAALLDTHTPHLVAASTPIEWDRARMHARTALGLLRYHYAMADTSPNRMARLLGVRAEMMAANLLALAERSPVFAFAHNSHFQRAKSRMQMWQGPVEWWSAGAIVDARLGEQYAVLATALGTIRHRGVQTPAVEVIEGLLYALPQERCVVDPRRLAAVLGEGTSEARVSPWFGYAPLDPAHLQDIDGLIFVRDA